MSKDSHVRVPISVQKAPNHWSRSESRQWSATLFAGTLACYAARVSLPICAVAVGKTYNWSKSDSGTVLSSFFWGYASTQAIGGRLADKYGGDAVLGIATLFWSLITLLMPLIFSLSYQTVYPLMILVGVRIAMGISQGMHFPSLASLTSKRLPAKERTSVFGFVQAGSHLGTVLCGSFGSLLQQRFGWRAVFYFVGAISLAWWIYLRHLMRSSSMDSQKLQETTTEGQLDARRAFENHTLLIHIPAIESAKIRETKEKQSDPCLIERVSENEGVPWGILFSKAAFWATICAHYVGAYAFYTLFSWLPTYFAESFPTAQGWIYNVVPHVAICISAMLAPSVATHLIAKDISVTKVRKLMESTSLIGMGLCLFIVAELKNFWAALACMTIALFIRGFHHAGVSVNAQDFAPNHSGAVFGVQNMASAIPGFVGVYFAGWLLEWFGNWAYVFRTAGIQCIIGAIAYALLGTAQQII